MILGVIKTANDQRAPLVPATLKKMTALGVEILIEKGVGTASNFADATYENVTAASRSEVLKQSNILLTIDLPTGKDLTQIPAETVVVGIFNPLNAPERLDDIKATDLRAFSLDMVPRTTLAQAMDVLSSMASIAGYQAVLQAAQHLPRYFPMMITAAGSIKPARVLVLGAGVAGLQAIATAKRLGAMVEAFDVRKAAKEEVQSLGAKFIEVEGAKDDTSAGGYAVEQSEDFIKRQRAEVQNRAMQSDVIITTAQVRGRKAPILVPATTVEKMKPGSVIVDLAASTGGNCELTQDNQIIQHNGVTIIGDSNLANQKAQDASTLLSNNFLNFLKLIVKDGAFIIDMENEILKAAKI
ncbi:MAG: NAD(P) transhydrogenase subunit alpha [Saprospiraceae bacterium]